jgi:glycosyltransferase involved in cell wall biosynthesis
MEFDTFNESDFVEVAWEGIIKDAMAKYPHLDKNKFIHVPNGFDSSDIPKVEVNRDEVDNAKFVMTYTGSMYGRRNPQALFEAIENLIKANKVDKSKFKLRFVGRFGNEVLEMIDKTSFKDSIETIGYVTHEKSIEFLLSSDALLLVVDESKESEEIVPGKVYEYMGVYKPLFTIAPENGAIAKLVRETNSGLIAHQSDIKGIAKIFEQYYTSKMNNQELISPKIDEINKYERRNSAKQLAELLDSIVG